MIPIARPHFRGREAEDIAEVIASGWVTQGPKVAEFETRVAEQVDAPFMVATTSCTTALHLSLLVSSIGPGDEVIVPSLSFIATANAVRHCGATPIFADVDSVTYNLDPVAVEASITEHTRAIIPVHQVGLPADIDAFASLASTHNLTIIEDAACALGARYRDRAIGSGPWLSCFSFHPRKTVTAGEGGMIAVHDESTAERLRRLRHHGMSVSDMDRHSSEHVVVEHYDEVGYNYRMTDLQAALGLSQMDVLDYCLSERRRLAERYTEAFEGLDGLQVPREPPPLHHAWQSYMVQVAEDAPTARDALMITLLEDGIATRRGIMASHLEAPYVGSWDLPVTERLARTGMLLPLFPDLSDADQDRIIERVRYHMGAR